MGDKTNFRTASRMGRTLALEPVVAQPDKREALEEPLEFSDAGWSVAVAFPGYTWERVNCDVWC
jgi:hypothetical protein